MNLTEYFYSLPSVDRPYNKYAAYSLAFGNPYKIISGMDVYRYDKLEDYLKRFIIEQGKCIVMPNMIDKEVVGLVIRSITSKSFRYHNECQYIPYGAGVNNKPFNKPWIIVESALDSDFLRNFYPFVIATNGVSVSNNIMNFLKGTSSHIYCGFDSDNAGNQAFHNLCYKHSGYDKEFYIKRFYPPKSLDGGYLKDFGEILDCLQKNNTTDYDYYILAIKGLISTIQ